MMVGLCQPGCAEARPGIGDKRFDEDEFGCDLFDGIAAAAALEAARAADLDPVVGLVDGTLEAAGVDESLKREHAMAETSRPVAGKPLAAQGQHP